MIRWAVDLLLGLLARWRGAADQARAEAMVERARREAVQDRAQADAEARAAPDPMAELRRDWSRPPAVALLLATSVLSACAAEPGPAQVRVVDTGCDWAKPITVNDMDQFSPATARDVLAHNKAWRARCGR